MMVARRTPGAGVRKPSHEQTWPARPFQCPELRVVRCHGSLSCLFVSDRTLVAIILLQRLIHIGQSIVFDDYRSNSSPPRERRNELIRRGWQYF